jgi:hypothetical protein
MRRSQLRGSTRRSVDKTRGRRQARRAVTIRLREDRGKGVGIFWRRCGLALCDHLRHRILVAPVIINFTARVRIDLCDESLDPSLLSQELLIVAIFLLGLALVLVLYFCLAWKEAQGLEAWKVKRSSHVSGFKGDLLGKLSRRRHSVSHLSVSCYCHQAQELDETALSAAFRSLGCGLSFPEIPRIFQPCQLFCDQWTLRESTSPGREPNFSENHATILLKNGRSSSFPVTECLYCRASLVCPCALASRITHLHCISGSHATLLSDRGERRKPVGRESSREPGSGLVGSGSRCGAQ